MKEFIVSQDQIIQQLNSRFRSIRGFIEEVKELMKSRTEILVQRDNKQSKDAAVLMALTSPYSLSDKIFEDENLFDHIYMILQQRSKYLNNNPGDMSFPGGSVEIDDQSLIETAYRESEEEMGIDREKLEFLGCMDEFVSSSGIIVRTVISWLQLDLPADNFRIELEKRYAPKTDEADETVVIPLSHLIIPDNYNCTEYFRMSNNSISRIGYVRYFDISKYLKDVSIWGLTASMIRRFFNIVIPDNLFPNEPIE